MRLDIPAGTAVRFEPGETQDGDAGGDRRRPRDPRRQRAGRAGTDVARPARDVCATLRTQEPSMSHRIERRHYADIYGPTTGDRVRLGDTRLVAEVERDATVYGDECKFGGGKVLRDGMGQAAGVSDARRARLRHHQRADHRLDRHPQGRRRHQGRPHRRHRQGRQPRRDGRRHAGHGRRRHDRGDRRRRADPHRRRHRRAHPLHLPAAGLRSARQRRHHVHRRRHRAGDRHQRHDLHARRAAHRADAAGHRRAADELRLPRQGQHVAARGARGADPRPARSA